jgi:tricarballylate dehydrogenase
VASFNAACRPGTFDPTVQDDCRTEEGTAKDALGAALTTPPFYGYPLRPGITFTYLGVKIDVAARLLMVDGHII